MDTSKTITDGGAFDTEGDSVHVVNGELVSYHQDESGESFITTESGEVVQLHTVVEPTSKRCVLTDKDKAASPYFSLVNGQYVAVSGGGCNHDDLIDAILDGDDYR